MYVVFEDLEKATDPKLHSLKCTHYQNRDRKATTTKWHGPYNSFIEAWNLCQAIAKRQKMVPQLAKCCIED